MRDLGLRLTGASLRWIVEQLESGRSTITLPIGENRLPNRIEMLVGEPSLPLASERWKRSIEVQAVRESGGLYQRMAASTAPSGIRMSSVTLALGLGAASGWVGAFSRKGSGALESLDSISIVDSRLPKILLARRELRLAPPGSPADMVGWALINRPPHSKSGPGRLERSANRHGRH